MTNGWNAAKAMVEKHSSEGIFVRLAQDGEKVTGVFCGEPHAREVVWTGERYEPFDGTNGAGKKPVLRVAINFFVPKDGAMKVIEGGAQWFGDVMKVRDKYGLEKWSFEIERKGAAGDTKTRYSVLPDEKIDDVLAAQVAAAQLHDLARVVNGDGGGGGEDDAFVDEKTAHEIVDKMRGLPRVEVDRILAMVGAKRVREIRARDVGRVRETLKLAAARAGDIDAFA